MKVSAKLFTVILFFPFVGLSQTPDTSFNERIIVPANSGTAKARPQDSAVYDGASLDLKSYFILLADDFKRQVTKPLHTSKRDWLKAGGFALLTGAVAFTNEPINRFAVKLHRENKAVAGISSYVTEFGGAYEVYTIAGLYAYGLIFKTQKEKTTTLLATQAYITAGLLSTAAKLLAGVQRPYYTDPNYNKSGPIFRGPFYPFSNGVDAQSYSSFPSGHTTAAFAAATVFALEYRDKPLIPIISYSAATLIGLSRLTENKHWPTDVLVGAMLGYLSGKQVVNNFHRYSNLKRKKVGMDAVSFNMNYSNKSFLAGLTYKF